MKPVSLLARLTQRQRQAVTVLGFANLIALVALGVLLVQAPPSADNTTLTSPIDTEHLDVCRRAISRALYKVDQSGMVHTRDNGAILVHLQHTGITTGLRQDADAAIWTALEAIASHNDCLGFSTIQITVAFVPSSSTLPLQIDGGDASQWKGQGLQATARLGMADLLRWSLGDIDDAELTLHIDYYPPATPLPIFLEGTTDP
jgi:hypothetical protein